MIRQQLQNNLISFLLPPLLPDAPKAMRRDTLNSIPPSTPPLTPRPKHNTQAETHSKKEKGKQKETKRLTQNPPTKQSPTKFPSQHISHQNFMLCTFNIRI